MIKFFKFNKLYLLIILITSFYILNKTNFYGNLQSIIKNNEKERIINIYGYCGGESVGYLKYLKSKYNFNSNPKIINYDRTGSNLWAIYNTNKTQTNNTFKILLNYPGNEIDINLNRIEDNLFEIYDMDFFSLLSNGNFIIKIKNNSAINNLKLEFFTKENSNNLKKIKVLEVKKESGKNFFFINYNLEKLSINEKRLFLKIFNNKLKNNADISFKLINKYQIDRLKILNQHENCYLIN